MSDQQQSTQAEPSEHDKNAVEDLEVRDEAASEVKGGDLTVDKVEAGSENIHR